MIGWFRRRLRAHIEWRVNQCVEERLKSFDARLEEVVEQRFGQFEKTIRPVMARELMERARLVNDHGNPNINELWWLGKDLDMMRGDLKVFGFDMARRLAAELPVRTGLPLQSVGLRSKCATQADLESDWAAAWAGVLGVPVVFHRKLWEYFYVLQGLWEQGCLAEGRRGIGFGCGTEPLPSCMAARGVDVLATDAPAGHERANDWADYRMSLEASYFPNLVAREQFERHVSQAAVDMNAIPDSLRNFDFCWSACALEHLGSIEKGLTFIERSLDVLKPGGWAIHTTEFNFANDRETIDHWPTVLYQRKHLADFAERLRAKGHWVAELDFDPGDKPLDKFVDLPPYKAGIREYFRNEMKDFDSHLKIGIDGFACTSFGLIVRKGSETTSS